MGTIVWIVKNNMFHNGRCYSIEESINTANGDGRAPGAQGQQTWLTIGIRYEWSQDRRAIVRWTSWRVRGRQGAERTGAGSGAGDREADGREAAPWVEGRATTRLLPDRAAGGGAAAELSEMTAECGSGRGGGKLTARWARRGSRGAGGTDEGGAPRSLEIDPSEAAEIRAALNWYEANREQRAGGVAAGALAGRATRRHDESQEEEHHKREVIRTICTLGQADRAACDRGEAAVEAAVCGR